MKTYLLAVSTSVLLVLASGVAQAKDWKAITIGVEGAFPPFNAVTPAGDLEGLDLDVAREVCKRAALNCTFVAQDWDSQIPSLVAGKFDAVLTMGPSPERREVIDFSNPYVITPDTFLVDANGPLADLPYTSVKLSIDSEEGKKALAELKEIITGTSIGATLSTTQLQFAESYFGDVAELKSYKSSLQSQLDLSNGRLDGIVDNLVFANVQAAESNGALKVVGPWMTGSIMATDVCFGIRKNEPELQAILNKAIAEMTADGTLKMLSEKWFKMDLSPS